MSPALVLRLVVIGSDVLLASAMRCRVSSTSFSIDFRDHALNFDLAQIRHRNFGKDVEHAWCIPDLCRLRTRSLRTPADRRADMPFSVNRLFGRRRHGSFPEPRPSPRGHSACAATRPALYRDGSPACLRFLRSLRDGSRDLLFDFFGGQRDFVFAAQTFGFNFGNLHRNSRHSIKLIRKWQRRLLRHRWVAFRRLREKMVRVKGLEPPRLTSQVPKTCVSTNSTTPAFHHLEVLSSKMMRRPLKRCDTLLISRCLSNSARK